MQSEYAILEGKILRKFIFNICKKSQLLTKGEKHKRRKMKETYLSANIETAYIKAWYDEATKRLLCDKYILAWIIISVIDEYKDCSVQYVRGCLIEGDVRTMSETVNPNEVMPAIKGLNTEIQINSEGRTTFDIYFNVIRPNPKENSHIYCDLEIQNDYYPGYDYVTRGVYNCARILSSQYNTEFAGSHYEKLKKAYSIWVCTDPPDKHKNSISVVSLQKNDKVSSVDRDKEKYDLINVISICLGGPEYANYDNKIIRLLDVLLRSKMTPEEKKKILEEEYEIPMSENIETEVNNMCSYIDTVYNEAMRIGNEQGEKRGEESMAMLGRQLLEENRIDELMKSYDNVEYRNKLMDQYGIK